MSKSTRFIIFLIFSIFCVALAYFKIEYFSPHGKQNIVLIALPKSGSTYFMRMLCDNLGYRRENIKIGYSAATNKYDSNLKQFFYTNSLLAKEHFRAPVNIINESRIDFMPPLDVMEFKKYSNKIVLHVRDPRQALLSLIYHINDDKKSRFVPVENRAWFDRQPLSKQIDWGIDNLLPKIINWIDDWLLFKYQEDQSPNGLQILVTTYEELTTDDVGLYSRVLHFYDINKQISVYASPRKDASVRYRKGDPNEWQNTYTNEQKRKIFAAVPQSMLQRFKWQNFQMP